MPIFACTVHMHKKYSQWTKVQMVSCTAVGWIPVVHVLLVVYSILPVFLWKRQSLQQQQQQIIPFTGGWRTTTYNVIKNSSIEIKPTRTNKYKRGKAYKKKWGACIHSNIWILLLFLHAPFCCCHTCYEHFPIISLFVHVLLASRRLWLTGKSLE